MQKTLPLPEFDLQTIQPIASHYTNYAILAHDKPAFTVVYLLMLSAPQTIEHCMKHTEAQFFTY
jgi:hypothetical protein